MSPYNGTQLSVFVHVFLELKRCQNNRIRCNNAEVLTQLSNELFQSLKRDAGNNDIPSFFFFLSAIVFNSKQPSKMIDTFMVLYGAKTSEIFEVMNLFVDAV